MARLKVGAARPSARVVGRMVCYSHNAGAVATASAVAFASCLATLLLLAYCKICSRAHGTVYPSVWAGPGLLSLATPHLRVLAGRIAPKIATARSTGEMSRKERKNQVQCRQHCIAASWRCNACATHVQPHSLPPLDGSDQGKEAP